MKRCVLCVVLVMVLMLAACDGQSSENPYAGDLLICLDAGHGGTDSGAVLDQRLEKDDNLAMALAVGAKLEAAGLQVVYTREEDAFVELKDRAAYANEQGACMFVSFHRNAGGGQGAEVWIDKSPDQWEKNLGAAIQKALVNIGFTNRGVKRGTASSKQQNYTVIGRTEMPACLVELGFIDSVDDNALLDTYHDELAQAIANAILGQVGKTAS